MAALWRMADQTVAVWSVLAVWFLWTQAMVAIFCLAMTLSKHARIHNRLARAHYTLLTAMVAAGQYAFEGVVQLDRWEAQLYEIEVEEPAVLTALMILCENQIKIARGQPDKTVPLRWWHRLMAHLYDFPRYAIT